MGSIFWGDSSMSFDCQHFKSALNGARHIGLLVHAYVCAYCFGTEYSTLRLANNLTPTV